MRLAQGVGRIDEHILHVVTADCPYEDHIDQRLPGGGAAAVVEAFQSRRQRHKGEIVLAAESAAPFFRQNAHDLEIDAPYLDRRLEWIDVGGEEAIDRILPTRHARTPT